MGLTFLTVDEVLEIHAYQVEMFGGDAGVRDMGLLESAIAQPAQSAQGEFLHRDLFVMAAAYLFHLVRNHPFIDGNKRTGTHCAIIFLELNGVSLELPCDEAEALVVRTACGQATKADIADFLRACVPG